MPFFKHVLTTLLLCITFSISSQEIRWMTWSEAVEANTKAPKKIFVDVYTDWCGWCKRMDQTTFMDSSVVAFMNEHFYAVKLNGEQKESITWKGNEYKWVPGGRFGYNELAAELLDRQMQYPTFVIRDEKFMPIRISPGYKDPNGLIKELRFAQQEAYKAMSWEEYFSKS